MTEHPFWIEGEDRPGRWLITVDHATNRVPKFINGGDLGIAAEDMARHIAYDVGIVGVSSRLGELLNSPVIYSNFSRLVIDPNRGEDDPTLLMKLYDGTIIPANRHADDAEKEARLNALHRPYHDAYTKLAARRDDTIICAMHSFTPALRARAMRPWHIGLLYADDRRLADPLLRSLEAEDDLCVGDNEPYYGHLPGDSIDRHALQTGRGNILIELRNDLIEKEDAQLRWAERLAPHLEHALSQANI